MRKLYSFLLFAVLSVTAFAESDSNYYWFYNRVEAAPTGKGVIYASDGYTSPESAADYTSAVEVKQYTQGFSTTSLYVWAQPAAGYQLAGWFGSAVDETVMAEQVATGTEAAIEVSTMQTSEDDLVEYYSFVPDATYYAIFSKVKVQPADGLASIALLDISKVANDTGDNITISASSSDPSAKFDYWTDSKGNKITDNPYSLTVSDVETYTAHFSGDSIITIDFSEGKYIPFSNAYSALLGNVKGYRIVPVEKTFTDENYNTISFDETENAWGYWDIEYDDDWNVISSEFHKYEGEIPSFDASYEISEFGYSYAAGDGVILYGKGEQSIILTNEETFPWDSYLVGTSAGAVNISDLPATDDDGNAMTYYVFDGTDFVKATAGTVAQNECYLALDATQYPLPEKILFASTEEVAIQGVAAEQSARTLVGIYTIDGKQVKAPVKGAINIINGKKVYVK